MEAVLALLVAVVVFVPCAMFGLFRKAAEDADRPEIERRVDRTINVGVTTIQRVNNLALTFIRTQIGGERPRELPAAERPPAEPPSGRAGGRLLGRGHDGDDGPATPPDPSGHAPSHDDLGGILGDLPQVPDPPRPPIWAGEAEVIRDRPPTGPAGVLPPADQIGGTPPNPSATPQSHDPSTSIPRRPAATAVAERAPLGGAQVVVDEPLVILEGVDMSDAPLVPTPDGHAIRLPSLQQMQAALATGGFEMFRHWLGALLRSSKTLLDRATNMHADAMAIARQTRTKYILALQAFQAVQHDRLDRATIARVWQVLEQAQREAVAAASATHATAALVVACGGSLPTVAAAIATLDRNHAAIATAVKASPQPVPSIGWYQQ